MAKGVTIVLVPPSATVTQLGTEQRRGVWVEDVSWDHSLPDHGARTAQFTVRREPEQEWPDLQPFTPVIIYKGGSVVWSGRIQQTPTIRGHENSITVICEGWPAHMKDDAIERTFVHNDLTSWRDMRTWLTTPLSAWTSSWDVTVGDGAAVIKVPLGTTAAINTAGGIQLDMGPYSTAKRIVVTYTGGGVANMSFIVIGADSDQSNEETFTLDLTPIATVSTTVAQTFVTPRRYVRLYAQATAALAGVEATSWLRIENVIVVADTAYESGNLSILKASQVVAAVLPYAPKISQSTTGITTGTFSIPHLAGVLTNPADYIDAVNAFHAWQWYLKDAADGGSPTMVFRAIPTSPTLVANVGNGIEFNDASRNDGSDIYNRVVVEYQDAAGGTARAERTTAGLSTTIADPDIVYDTFSSVAAGPNPGFESAIGVTWTVSSSTLAQDLAVFDTGLASGRATSSAGGIVVQYTIATGLTPGRTYKLNYRVRNNAAWLAGTIFAGAYEVANTAIALGTPDSFTTAIGATFSSRSFTFTPRGTTAALLWFGSGLTAAANIFYLDGLALMEPRPTIVDRQNFTRTRVLATGSRLIAAAANQIGDVYLQAHRFTPLRGSLTVVGPALRALLGDVPIPAHMISRSLGDAILINETDPDLGTIGRVGYIAAVAYDESSDTAQIAIDTQKDFVDQLLARLAVFS